MTLALIASALFCGFAALVHLAGIAVAMIRCRPQPHQPVSYDAPGVTLIRPVCGIDNFVEETLRSSFTLHYPRYEIIFCVASARDPVVPLVQRLIAAYPDVPARLLVGDERISTNPKLNNCFKGWRAACYDWIILSDSNVSMPRDYIQRLLAAWTPDTGLVCSPPAGTRPVGFWAELECAFLNTYQARWQYVADTAGRGFAQGKTMLWRRELLERAGGIRVLGEETAEDAASTKVVRAAGLRVRLVDAPFGQPLGRRSAIDVWNRQVRWARLRRASFPLYFMPEVIAGALLPLVACGFAAAALDVSVPAALMGFATLWYGAEIVLARAAGWPLSASTPLALMLRDLLLPLVWIEGWRDGGFVWRGTAMRADSALPASRAGD